MAGALDGYRVVDITSILSGPYGTQLLGDAGADIIKVTKPPVSYSETPNSIRRQAPRLGQNGAEILAALGYDQDAITAMQASGALAGEAEN